MFSDPEFRFGAGRTCLDLIRTLRHRGRPDEEEELPDNDAWDAWLRAAGLGWADRDGDPARSARARELREHIARLVAAIVDDGIRAVDGEDLRAVNAAAAHAVAAPRLDARGRLHFASEHSGQAARAALARDAIELVASTDPARLRRCADPDCRTIFYDSSRPGVRRWCAMSGCGARAKKAQQRARDRATASARRPAP